jgi:hypothetical protein
MEKIKMFNMFNKKEIKEEVKMVETQVKVNKQTLGKAVTATFFKTPEDYMRLKQAWSKKMIAKEELSFEHHICYLMLMGKDWTKAVTLPKEDKRFDISRPHYNLIDEALMAPAVVDTFKFSNVYDDNGKYVKTDKVPSFFREFIVDDTVIKLKDCLPNYDEVKPAFEGHNVPAYKL